MSKTEPVSLVALVFLLALIALTSFARLEQPSPVLAGVMHSEIKTCMKLDSTLKNRRLAA
ncbi:hypothetical protein [Pseudomonas massiliensis]|uniref:hypothetical protein n=1 Tax=Pseudomonas massiliensis TaxID=522492 RepID=UPI0011DD917D|nr:hypothetical protein [Pseudomonas massiliensis]